MRLPSVLQARVRQVYVLTKKELRQLVRDRVLFVFIVYIFSLHIVISTLGVSDDLRRMPVVLHDADRSTESRDLVQRLRPPYFVVRREVANAREGQRALDQGEARVFVNVPDDFSEKLGRSEEDVSVQVLIDTSKVSLGYLASSYAARIAQGFGSEIAAARLARQGIATPPPRIESRQRTWFNFTLDTRWAASLSSLLTMMTVACVMLPAAAVVREKERGTIEQLLVSPLAPLQIMAAKVAAMVLVTLAGTLLAVHAILMPLFGVPLRGSEPLFFAMVALYALALAGLGLAIATLGRTSAQVGLLVILTVMPMVNLSGTYVPVEGMPQAMRWAVQLSPLHHFGHIAYGIALRGEGFATLWPSAAAIAAVGVVLLAFGLLRFRTQLT